MARQALALMVGMHLAVAVYATPVAACQTTARYSVGMGHVYVLQECPATSRLKGDWESPEALLIAYSESWPSIVDALISGAAEDTPVYLLVNPADNLEALADILSQHPAEVVTPVFIYFDTPWVRDYGPLQVQDAFGHRQWLDLVYSEERSQDDELPKQLGLRLAINVQHSRVSLDGGALIGNGQGLCVVTHRNLLEAGVDGDDAHSMARFQRTVGCSVLAEIPDLLGEPTGHADLVAHFFAPNRLGLAEVDPVEFPWYAEVLEEALEVLQAAAAYANIQLEVVRVPMHIDGDIFYSYLNATRLKRRALIPAYDAVEPALQAAAFAALRRAMPKTELVPVPADVLISLGGAVHCVTLGVDLPKGQSSGLRAHRRCGRGKKWVSGRCLQRGHRRL